MQWITGFTSAEKKHAYFSRSSRPCLCVSSNHRGIVHYELIVQRQTVNQQCYWEVLTGLRESVRRKIPELWPDRWFLHNDNAPAHDALRFREFLAKKSITNKENPPYSLDLAPCYFLVLSKIKKCPEGTKICRHS
jgi:hypothetical protein